MFSREIADRIKLKLGITQNNFPTMLTTRKLIDNVKKELHIEHDKELAELAEIKVGTLTQAIARNSFQFETLIPFLLGRGVDLNRIFVSDGVNTIAKIDPAIIQLESKLLEYNKFSEKFIAGPFKAELEHLYEKYDKKIQELISIFQAGSTKNSSLKDTVDCFGKSENQAGKINES